MENILSNTPIFIGFLKDTVTMATIISKELTMTDQHVAWQFVKYSGDTFAK